MNVLVFGPSGAGKTYVSTQLRAMNVHAVDADEIEGLSSWWDGAGNKVSYKEDADQEFLENHSFLWDRTFLEEYLHKNSGVIIFGAAGNVFDVIDLFDKAYFLKVQPEVQKKRLMHASRKNPMGNTEYQRENAVKWGRELEERAKKLNIPFVDATLSPQNILVIITESN